MPILIGIGHKKRSGKDTSANRLVDKHHFIRISWADSLKESARIIFGFNDAQLYGDLKEVLDPYWGFSPREALQALGSDACRDVIDKDIWIKSAWRRIEKLTKENPTLPGIVIPDVRYPNEANFIKEKGGTLWRVDRKLVVDHTSTHISETALDSFTGWDAVIDNNYSLKMLYQNIDKQIELVKQKESRRTNVFNSRKTRGS